MPVDEDLIALGKGEQAAIAVAVAHKGALLLIDEEKGRRAAKRRNIKIIGVIGILDAAGRLGFVDIVSSIYRLKQTNFRIAPQLIEKLLEEHAGKESGL
jgi:predicted nucleic acid-binding protein